MPQPTHILECKIYLTMRHILIDICKLELNKSTAMTCFRSTFMHIMHYIVENWSNMM